MISCARYIEMIKEKTGMKQFEIAISIGLSKTAISTYTKGKNFFGLEVCYRVAKILEINPMQVILDAEIERNRMPELTHELKIQYLMMFGESENGKKSGENYDLLKHCA